ncbi:MAG: phosphoribosylaminoimidazolesuccinocarboxamide synthase [Candidatus Eisenbacteria sp.]|nr:phosphoribosylaminoimidazolesuccinocarboxamide synthase [Candidatus Eisenbacteria bacterium]
MTRVVDETRLTQVPLLRRGKVRDIYDLGNQLLLVATDRVSAFDVVLPTPIPDKGCVLTQLSEFWFGMTTGILANHMISTNTSDFPPELQPEAETLEGRSTLVKKTRPIEVECVVRGCICGSAWKEYRDGGTVAGEPFPPGLVEFGLFPEVVFTPAVKRHEGHDENISFAELIDTVGPDLAERLKNLSVAIYELGRAHAGQAGFILADAKFEFGWDGDELILIDEVLTPDSSRYWVAETWVPGKPPDSADKQLVRDYLTSIGWDGTPPVPVLPGDLVDLVRSRYREIYRRLVGSELP